MAAEESDSTRYSVVVNDEEQHSLWPADKALPAGWRKAGMEGGKADCLAYIAENWQDMRPLSLRRRADARA